VLMAATYFMERWLFPPFDKARNAFDSNR
jgi:hypothetical protein